MIWLGSRYMATENVLLKEFDSSIDLYKFYITISEKIAIWVIAITGAILSFYFATFGPESVSKLSATVVKGNHGFSKILYFPLFLNVSFAVVCLVSIRLVRNLASEHIRISDELGMGESIKLSALPYLLYLFTAMFSVIALGVIYVLYAL